MEEKKFLALVSLLEDDDPGVSNHVESVLLDFGIQGILRLESAWEMNADPKVQERIEDIIQKIRVKDLSGKLIDWKNSPEQDLLNMWHIVSEFQNPELDRDKYISNINKLTNKIWLELNDRMSIYEKLKIINYMIFSLEGFKPEPDNTKTPGAHFISTLMSNKTGNVFSLGLLYLIITRKLNIRLYGIALEEYFLLLQPDMPGPFYIDPMHRGVFFTPRELETFLSKIKVPMSELFLKPSDHVLLAKSMLESLKKSYSSGFKPSKAEDIAQLINVL